MLRMIVADDDYLARDQMRNIVNWEDYGIEVIAEACDGEEALELCLSLQPDILLTDIRMPLMDGLDVAVRLREQGRDLYIIISSGVQDFNYARTALSAGVEDYILKPIKIEEFRETITKVVTGIQREKNKDSKLQELKQQLKENMTVVREKFLRSLISDKYTDEQAIWSKLQYFELPLIPADSMMAAVLQIDEWDGTVWKNTEEDLQLLHFSIANILDEIMNNHKAGISFHNTENEHVILFSRCYTTESKYTVVCEEIVSCINKFLSTAVSIGIGRPVGGIRQISISYKDAVAAVQYKFYTGKNSIVNITDISRFDDIPPLQDKLEYSNLYELESRLIGYMKLGDSGRVEECMKTLFSHLAADKKHPVDYIQSVCVEAVFAASRALHELDEDIDKVVANRLVIMDSIYKITNIMDLEQYLLSIFMTMAAYFSKKHDQKNLRIAGKIKEIIHRRYREGITVQKIAEDIYLTPNYISLIFKQETGETITEYITRIRMEAAMELLKTTDFKVMEIAEMVGFENSYYFSTVFKKHTGIHPNKYRSCSGSEE